MAEKELHILITVSDPREIDMLWAAGADDLREYFLPEQLGIHSAEVHMRILPPRSERHKILTEGQGVPVQRSLREDGMEAMGGGDDFSV